MFNPTLDPINTMILGLVAAILMISLMSIMSQAVVRERESGTLEQMFVTPIRPSEYLIGKVAPYALLCRRAAEQAVAAIGMLWFKVPFNGSVWVVLRRARAVPAHLGGAGVARLAHLPNPPTGPAGTGFHHDPHDGAVRFHLPHRVDAGGDPTHEASPLRYALTVLRGSFVKGSGFEALLPRCGPWWVSLSSSSGRPSSPPVAGSLSEGVL